MLEWSVKASFMCSKRSDNINDDSNMVIASSTEQDDCADGELRLEGGRDSVEGGTRDGRLEICFNRAWGTVCNTSFGIPDAIVACGELPGFQRNGIPEILTYSSMVLCMILCYDCVFRSSKCETGICYCWFWTSVFGPTLLF